MGVATDGAEGGGGDGADAQMIGVRGEAGRRLEGDDDVGLPGA